MSNELNGKYIAEVFPIKLRLIQAESDRGAVLVAASMLEDSLKRLIAAKLAPSFTKKDLLFSEGNAPLGTFSSRIEIAYRLGLITIETKELLSIFKKVRNDFAHQVKVDSFELPKVKDRMVSLMAKHPEIKGAFETSFIESIAQSNKLTTESANKFYKENWPLRTTFDFFFASTISTLESLIQQQDQLRPLKKG
ncbi:putative mannitol operon repressor domain protein [Vibrio parahaemolyticus]|uniref:Mannitol repressor n=1 Tax=Vibrio parahaemolyticus TaxID=670 RepID=A0A249W4X2_VIBPH|nr:putative mannitol operon repressor domain protein [Vibrio parahaemolyticus]ASZ51792.1 hypothetical protein YA91_15060 [Vibrio parahaemolyticus]EGQ7712529.1 hypothetical protein [Vibrio parahaemolyticus]EGQ7774579.1 hypothetical protein [Vibrio parahaemolyticus]EGQ7805680.1 hypothetical protein [Vibrio parahaemolyticus]EGQ7864091.1 hypothetical protein [Vibrio parahaemolyticus]